MNLADMMKLYPGKKYEYEGVVYYLDNLAESWFNGDTHLIQTRHH